MASVRFAVVVLTAVSPPLEQLALRAVSPSPPPQTVALDLANSKPRWRWGSGNEHQDMYGKA
jgi:hypothetical protein